MTPDVDKWLWWPAANKRRGELIVKKISRHLTKQEAAEYAVLQGIATLVMAAATPPLDLSPLEAIVKRAEKLAAKIQRQLHKVQGKNRFQRKLDALPRKVTEI